MQLREIIIEKIHSQGPISFRDFMEMALYYPALGYYTSEKEKIGTAGDFYTSATLSPVFGAMIGRQLEEMWRLLDKEPFTIIEYGAGTGKLCHDILEYLKNNAELYEKLRYCIIEKSDTMQEQEKSSLHEKVTWHTAISEIPEIVGCVISNELLDNFAVHQVIMQEELMEVYVDYHDDFVEVLRPASQEIKDYFAELSVQLPKGFQTEVNLQAIDWITQIAKSLKKGYVLTIDYGYPSALLYSEQRKCGTLLCYNRHSVNDHPYSDIGNQDITSHVNFSALCHWGFKNGLLCCGLTDQANFLLGLGFKEYLQNSRELKENTITTVMEETFLSHILLQDMGTKYKVLIQRKGVSLQPLLGLQP